MRALVRRLTKGKLKCTRYAVHIAALIHSASSDHSSRTFPGVVVNSAVSPPVAITATPNVIAILTPTIYYAPEYGNLLPYIQNTKSLTMHTQETSYSTAFQCLAMGSCEWREINSI